MIMMRMMMILMRMVGMIDEHHDMDDLAINFSLSHIFFYR